MTKGLISIIVPCYMKDNYLADTLDSVISQTYAHWECIIVNDGSPDNTEAIAKKYCNRDNRFRYLFQHNSGLSNSRNNGIKASSGEYILPLDADDIIGNTYLEKAITHFNSYPYTKLVYCKARKFGVENGIWELPPYDYDKLMWNNCLFCTSMYRRADYDKTSGYNSNMKYGLEDWDFWLSLLKKDDVIYQIDEILFFYRTTSNSMIKKISDNTKKMHRQLVINHPEVYSNHFQDLIDLKLQIQSLQEALSHANYEIGRITHRRVFQITDKVSHFLKRLCCR